MPDAIAQAAEALAESARCHKRASAFHRREARRCREQIERLRARCAEIGIKLEIGGEPEGGDHGRERSGYQHIDVAPSPAR